jgi:hypothetical protein
MSFIWALYLLLNYCKNWSCWDEFYVGWILYEMCIFLNDTGCAMGCGGTEMGHVELRSYLATSSSTWLPCQRHVAAASASCCCHSVPHVDKPQRDTWRCVKEPRHHIHVSTRLATSAAIMGRATWHPLPWPISWPFGLVIEEIHSMTKNVLVMEKFHFYDQNDRLVMVDQIWRSFCDQFNLVISWS